jgi:hypothetical protein
MSKKEYPLKSFVSDVKRTLTHHDSGVGVIVDEDNYFATAVIHPDESPTGKFSTEQILIKSYLLIRTRNRVFRIKIEEA